MDLTELRRTIISCKESITSATEDLTKLTGRNYDKSLDVNRQFSNVPIVSKDNFKINQRLTMKRQNSREKEYPAEVKRFRGDKEAPSINSVVQVTKGRTRNDAMHDLKTTENSKEKERCKRLFGHLMGTLNSIKKESEKVTNDPQQVTRLKIEKKVEEDHKLMSEKIQKEQNELIRTKRERENELKNLNQRYRAAEAFERWRLEKEKMKGYIRTSKPPYIFYKPRIINEEAQLRIDETARVIDLMIETRKTKLAGDIERVVKRHQGIPWDDKVLDGSEPNDAMSEEPLVGSIVSVVSHINGKNRAVSPAHSFASEDYDDMIEEIEISMHDDPVQAHDDGGRYLADRDIANNNEEPKMDAIDNKIIVKGDHELESLEKMVDADNQNFDIEFQNVNVDTENLQVENQVINMDNKDVYSGDNKADIEAKTTDLDIENVNPDCHSTVNTDQVDSLLLDVERIIAEDIILEEENQVNLSRDIADLNQVTTVPESSQD